MSVDLRCTSRSAFRQRMPCLGGAVASVTVCWVGASPGTHPTNRDQSGGEQVFPRAA